MTAPKQNNQNPGWYRFMIGEFEATVTWDGYIHHAYEGLFPNGTAEELARLQALYALPSDHIPMDLNPAVVNTGSHLCVIDGGMGTYATMFGDTMGHMVANMKAAGIDPADVDLVLMSHLHPDHSFGLINADGSAVYANATLVVTREDWDEWTNEANLSASDHKAPWTEGTLKAVKPYHEAGKVRFVSEGEEVIPGVRVKMVPGHSLGQCAYIFESQGEKVMFTGDVAHHQVFDPVHPEWYFHNQFDSDPPLGAKSKAMIFAYAVDNGIRFHGYHFPYPGLGDLTRGADGTYRWHAQPAVPRLPYPYRKA